MALEIAQSREKPFKSKRYSQMNREGSNQPKQAYKEAKARLIPKEKKLNLSTTYKLHNGQGIPSTLS